MLKHQKLLSVLMFAFIVFQVLIVSMNTAHAGIQEQVNQYNQSGGTGIVTEVNKTGDDIVNAVRQIFSTLAVIVVIVAGLVWGFAHGDPNKIMLAKKILAGAVVAILIAFKAEMIVGGFYGLFGITVP